MHSFRTGRADNRGRFLVRPVRSEPSVDPRILMFGYPLVLPKLNEYYKILVLSKPPTKLSFAFVLNQRSLTVRITK